MSYKQCKKCYEFKLLEDFHNDKRRKDGKYPNCKKCHYEYTRERYKNPIVKEKRIKYYNKVKDTEKYKKEAKKRCEKYYTSVLGRAKTLFNNAQKSPAGKKFPFTLTLSVLEDKISIKKCNVTGLDLDLSISKNNFQKALSPSIDRIDSSKGYSDENTRIVCWWYNMAKSDLTDEEMKYFCKKVSEL